MTSPKVGDKTRTKRNTRTLPVWLRGITCTIVGFEPCSPIDVYYMVRFDEQCYADMHYPFPCYKDELCKIR